MAFKNLVKGSVKKAFRQLKDLAIDVVLTKTDTTGFDFNNQDPQLVANGSVTVKAILVNQKNSLTSNSKGTYSTRNGLQAQLILDASDFSGGDIYDTATFNGQTWNIIPPYDNNGYTITINLAKEA